MPIMQLNGELSTKLKTFVTEKLKELCHHFDEELPDYVLVMLANGRSNEAMYEDLKFFLGSKAHAFVDWLYDILDQLKNSSETAKSVHNINTQEISVVNFDLAHSTNGTVLHDGSHDMEIVAMGDFSHSNSDHAGTMSISTNETVTHSNSSEMKISSLVVATDDFRLSSLKSHAKNRLHKFPDIESKMGDQEDRQGEFKRFSKVGEETSQYSPPFSLPSLVQIPGRPKIDIKKCGLEGNFLLMKRAFRGAIADSKKASQRGRSRINMEENKSKRVICSDQPTSIAIKRKRTLVDDSPIFFVTMNNSNGLSTKDNLSMSVDEEKQEVVDKMNGEEVQAPTVLAEEKVPISSSSSPHLDSLQQGVAPVFEMLKNEFIVRVDTDDEDDEDVDDEEDGTTVKRCKKSKSDESSLSNGSRVVVLPEELPPPPKSVSINERCRYWPACRKGRECPYIHPSEQCKAFPHCRFGGMCHFLHPECRFQEACAIVDCPYTHSRVSKTLVTAISLNSGITNSFTFPNNAFTYRAPGVSSSLHQKRCYFYPNCTKPNCNFWHPTNVTNPASVHKWVNPNTPNIPTTTGSVQ